MKYTPRRASKRWLEGAPEWVLDCFDNGGETHDRYDVLLCGTQLVSDGTYAGTYVQFVASNAAGGTYWGELKAHECAAYRYRNSHYRVAWASLPKCVQDAVIDRVMKD